MSPAERQAFLDAIREAPEDDTPRLVFADWLDDHGDSDRAEFIRGRVRLAGMSPWDDGAVALEIRCRHLLQAHRDEWLAPLQGPPRTDWYWTDWHTFRRGFPEALEVVPASFPEAADRIFSAAPVLALALSFPYDSTRFPERFWACHQLSRLRKIWFYRRGDRQPRFAERLFRPAHERLADLAFPSDLVEDPAGLVVAAPFAPNLRRLQIASRETDGAPWHDLWRTDRLPRLERFAFRTRYDLPAQLHFADLASAPWFAGLTHLTLAGGGSPSWLPLLRLGGLDRILRDGRLRSLLIDECGIPDETAAGFRTLPPVPLERLELGSGRGIGRKVLRALLQSPGLARLRAFGLSGDAGAAIHSLLDSPLRDSLRLLRLVGAPCRALLRLARVGCPRVTRLTVSLGRESDASNLLPAVVDALLDGRSFPQLVSLVFFGSYGSRKRVIPLLARHPGAARLRELVVAARTVPEDVRALVESVPLGGLSRLAIPNLLLPGASQDREAWATRLRQRFGRRYDGRWPLRQFEEQEWG